jgi:hypothetical protein
LQEQVVSVGAVRRDALAELGEDGSGGNDEVSYLAEVRGGERAGFG